MPARFVISVSFIAAFLIALPSLHAAGASPKSAVTHAPAQPRSGDAVAITADLAEANNVVLHFQAVEPGKYLRKTDPGFTNSWRELSMSRSNPRDSVFSGTIPGDTQQHRRLVRYFISFTDTNGIMARIPAATNDCPNFACFVYDGLPGWTGANRPGKSTPLTFPADFMNTLPAFHLFARREDVEQSQWDGGANKKRFYGTIIYEGRVYDHVQFHNRGKASTYVAGKNKWGFKFNPAQPFHDHDLWGRPSTNTWKSLSLTACASPWAQVNRGMAGMDEAVSFRAYQLAGVPSADMHWIQLRVIDGRDEAPMNQYEGDLWGLYQVVQEPGSEWLRARGLPDGEIYSPETGVKHHAKGAPTNDVAFQQFMSGPHGSSPEAWWRANMDLPRYYTFHALNRVLGNVDVRPGANYYLVREADGRWCVVPWDLDMMFIAKTHQAGFVDQARCLEVPSLRLEYKERARELLDLFCSDSSPNGGQIGQLVDELSRMIKPAGFEHGWPELDMCLWNWHPRSNAKGQFYVSPAGDGRFGGGWTRTLATPDFAGFCKYIVDYCSDSRPVKNYAINDGDQRGYGFGFLSIESNDERIPQRPVIKFSDGSASTLKFAISPFKAAEKAAKSQFAAMQWRLARISAPGLAGYKTGEPRQYEIQETMRSDELPVVPDSFGVPAGVCEASHTYRIRARYKDNTGRWSRWSEPVQFVAR